MSSTRAMGVDVGFRCTGLALVRLNKEGDELADSRAICPKPSKASSAVLRDVEDCFALLEGLQAAIREWRPAGIFVELPHGGAQSSRAARCMGMATALVLPFLQYENVGFELYTPLDVEGTLGIHLAPGDAQKLKLSKGESTKWKKARVKDLVDAEWPDFKGWPDKADKAEDAYDAAAAFLCGRKKGRLYGRLKP